MKTGYPFLTISKKHNVEYADVLFVADHLKNKGNFHENIPALPIEVISDINKANDEFKGMQLGLFDWQAGHHVS